MARSDYSEVVELAIELLAEWGETDSTLAMVRDAFEEAARTVPGLQQYARKWDRQVVAARAGIGGSSDDAGGRG